MYYLRTKPATNAIQFTVDKSKLAQKTTTPNSTPVKKEKPVEEEEDDEELDAAFVCRRDNPDACVMCSG